MKKWLLLFVSALGLLLVVSTASADNLKIGVLDVEQIIQKSPQIASINGQLTKQFKPRQEKLIEVQKNLQAEMEKFNRNSAVMSVAERDKLQDQINADKGNAQTMAIAFQRDLNTAQAQAMQSFMGELSGVVATVAKNGKYDLILQRGGVPYASPTLDVTSLVLDELKKKG